MRTATRTATRRISFPGRVISAGSKDRASVLAIQRRLNQVGCGPVAEDGVFGPETADAVELFQARSVDQHGSPLLVDGSVGPMTWAALFGAVPAVETAETPLHTAVLEVAGSQVGVMEEPPGSNRGPKVDVYLRSVGINPAAGSSPGVRHSYTGAFSRHRKSLRFQIRQSAAPEFWMFGIEPAARECHASHRLKHRTNLAS
jgi:hypothetical protein